MYSIARNTLRLQITSPSLLISQLPRQTRFQFSTQTSLSEGYRSTSYSRDSSERRPSYDRSDRGGGRPERRRSNDRYATSNDYSRSSNRSTTFRNPSSNMNRACYNCGEEGHRAADCPTGQSGGQRAPKKCYNCGGDHIAAQCTEEPKPKSCYKCGESGHISRECPQSEGQTGGYQREVTCYTCGGNHFARDCPEGSGQRRDVTCYNCNQTGHISRDCPTKQTSSYGGAQRGGYGGQQRSTKCYNCNEEGHLSRDCPQGQVRTCYQCGQTGHISRDCPGASNEVAQ